MLVSFKRLEVNARGEPTAYLKMNWLSVRNNRFNDRGDFWA